MRCSSRLLLLSDALLPVDIFLSTDFGKLEMDSGPESKLLPDFRLERSELWLKVGISLAVPKCTDKLEIEKREIVGYLPKFKMTTTERKLYY